MSNSLLTAHSVLDYISAEGDENSEKVESVLDFASALGLEALNEQV